MDKIKYDRKSIEKRINELNDEIKYEEEKLKCCGYGKSDLLYLEGLKEKLVELEELLDNLE